MLKFEYYVRDDFLSMILYILNSNFYGVRSVNAENKM